MAKIPGYSNPVIDYDFGADPFALTYDGRVYLYMTADQFEYDAEGNLIDNTYSKINKLHVVSSADMVNWTDHGFVQVAGENGAAKWANHSWAPAAAYKKLMEKINSSCISVMAEAASECSRETLRWDHLEIQMEKHL